MVVPVEELEANRYNPEFIGTLEASLKSQVASGEYSKDENITLLKFYQHSPKLINLESLGNILIKSMMALPSTDFLTCLYLIPEKIQQESSIAPLISLARHLETANFVAFWKEAQPLKSRLDTVKGFNEAIRNFMAEIVCISYKKISKNDVAVLLNVDVGTVDRLASDKNWKVSGTDLEFPENLKPVKAKNAREPIRFEQLLPVLNKIFK